MHYLPFGDRLNKGILMVTQLIKGFTRIFSLAFITLLYNLKNTVCFT